jgi:uncharacterized protein YndB with AHSA1/START domain
VVPDQISSETFVAAPVERVWAVLTRAEHLAVWFGGAGAEVDLRPGGRLTLTWEEHGTALCLVERVEEPTFFSFRWSKEAGKEPGPGDATLVEFALSPEDDGTRVRVVESGFASLDGTDDENAAYAEGNVGGWEHELRDLADHVARLAA